MANSSSPKCQCRQNRDAMQTGQQLGLDELMIVNPSQTGTEALQRTGEFFLGEDGTLYLVHGLGSNGLGEAEAHEPGRFFLGEDGTLYELIR